MFDWSQFVVEDSPQPQSPQPQPTPEFDWSGAVAGPELSVGDHAAAAGSYLKQSAIAGMHNLKAAGAKIAAELTPGVTESEAITLSGGDPAKLEAIRAANAATPLYEYADEQNALAGEAMRNISPEAQQQYGNLEYATTDVDRAAWASPVKVVGDAMVSAPTTAALAGTALLTRGAGGSAYRSAILEGATPEAAKQAAIVSAGKTAAKVGAVSEGTVGYAQQSLGTSEQIKNMPFEQLAESDEFIALIRDEGFTKEQARDYLAYRTGEQSGIVAGVVDAATNAVAGKYLGEIIGEGGKLAPRVAKGAATEAVTETVQSGGEQFGENLAMQHVDPNQDLGAGVGESMVQGAAVGGLTGGVVSGAFGGAHDAPAAQPGAPSTVDSTDLQPLGPETTEYASEPTFDWSTHVVPPQGEPVPVRPGNPPEVPPIGANENAGVFASMGGPYEADDLSTYSDVLGSDVVQADQGVNKSPELITPSPAVAENTDPVAENAPVIAENAPAVADPVEKIAPAAQAATPRQKKATKGKGINPERDDVKAIVAKMGGISREEAKAQGIDPAHFNLRGWSIRPVFPAKGGMSFDQAAEALSELGFFPDGQYTANGALDMLDRALRGEDVRTPAGAEWKAQQDEIRRQEDEALKADNEALLDSIAYDDIEGAKADVPEATGADLLIARRAGEAMAAGVPHDAIGSIIDNENTGSVIAALDEAIKNANQAQPANSSEAAGSVHETGSGESESGGDGAIPFGEQAGDSRELETDDEIDRFFFGGESVDSIIASRKQQQADEPLLSQHTEADIKAKVSRESDTKAQKAAEHKAAIDATSDVFTLSSGAATVSGGAKKPAVSGGQNDLLSASVKNDIDAAAHEAATSPLNDLPEPTPEQIESGEYPKGKFRLHDLPIQIENPKGSIRRSKPGAAKKWENEMFAHYGDIEGTIGADGDPLDVFIGEKPESTRVFVIDQPAENGGFDEHKIMIGFENKLQATNMYRRHYPKGWKVGHVTELSVDEFKEWLRDGDTTVALQPADVIPANEGQTTIQASPSVLDAPSAKLQKRLDELLGKREKWQRQHMEKYRNGSATRAQTTTHNARIADLNEQIQELRKEIKARAASPETGSLTTQLAGMSADDLSALIDEVATEKQVAPKPKEAKPKAPPKPKKPAVPKWATELGISAGSRVRATRKIDYLTPGEVYTLETVQLGSSYFRNDSGSGTSLQTWQIKRGFEDGSLVLEKAEPQNPPTAADRTAGQIAKSLGVNLSAAGGEAVKGLTELFGAKGRLSSGLTFDEETYAKAKPHFKAMLADFEAAGKDLRDFIRAVLDNFGAGVKPYIIQFAQDLRDGKDQGDAANTPRSVERNSESTSDGAGRVRSTVQDERSGDRAGSNEAGARRGGQRSGRTDGVPDGGGATDPARSNQRVGSGKPGLAGSTAGSADGGRSSDDSAPGLPAGQATDGAIESAIAKSAVTPRKAKSLQGEWIPADVDQIKQQMPFLTDGQVEDVAFAETRFEKPTGYGVLFTNGTGTGKTFTGLGIVKRLVSRGKKNILVAVPKQTIADAWVKAGAKFFGLTITPLESTKDNGKEGIAVTTFANLGENETLADREWDAFVMDEAHYLSSSQDGKNTNALKTLQAIAYQRGTSHALTYLRHRDLVSRMNQLRADAKMARTMEDNSEGTALDAKADAIATQLHDYREQIDAQIDAMKPEDRPRSVFLSATPFAYEKSVMWANEFLFDWGDGQDGGAYNSGNNFERFMMQHFGYRMRYNKLTEPDAKINRGLMQRAFNAWLKKEGVLSGRGLDSDFDYDRRFVLTESAIGRRVDEALTWLREHSSGDKKIEGMSEVADSIRDQFSYHARMYFLEAIKAREAIPFINANVSLGRKVLVMHDFKKGGVVNPFRLQPGSQTERDAYALFQDSFDDLIRAFSYLPSPIETITGEFPDALVYNGNVSAKKRIVMEDQFNSDDSTAPRVMVAQGDAMREGVSIHDTTGKHQRVLVHLGMPSKPTAAIQQEGRIYRTGQASNAMFRYFTIGTWWERNAFAQTIASRADTADNLAMGELARGLKQQFFDAYENAGDFTPGFEGEGTGGKQADKDMANILTPWDSAKSFYFGTKKQGSGRSAAGREGRDYFATPEPLGLKMVEWADIRGGESVLEPSAGHGAIARWFPENAKKRVIEASEDLASRVAMVVDGDVVNGPFEAHNVVNKYDAIVMNPPFGNGGKTAIDHLAKAVNHLRDGGRVVALIPTGPAADKQFDNWFYGKDDKGNPDVVDVHLIRSIRLPAVTFERAGTTIATRVVILEKASGEAGKSVVQRANFDISSANSISEFFDRIELMEVPPRVKPVEEEATAEPEAKPAAKARADNFEGFDLKQTTHAKHGYELFVAVPKNRVEREEYNLVNAIAKKNGGWYSAFKGTGAIPGFQFKSEEARAAFLAEASGNGVDSMSFRVSESSTLNPGASPKGLTVEETQKIVGEFLSRFPGADDVSVSIRRTQQDAFGPAGRSLGRVKGAFDHRSNRLILISSNLHNARDAIETIQHEILVHKGLGLFSVDGENKIVHGLKVHRGEPSLKEAWEHVEKNYADKSPTIQAEEVLAYIAEKKLSLLDRTWTKLLFSMRAALRRFGLLSDNAGMVEFRKLIYDMADAFAQGKRARLRDLDPSFSSSAPPPVQSGAGSQNPGNAVWQTEDMGLLDNLVYKMQDRHIDTKRVQQAIAEAGNDIEDAWNPYLKEELFHGRSASRVKEFLDKELKPLLVQMSIRKVSMPDIEKYLWMRHAEERNVRIAQINPKMPDGGAGVTTTEAQAYLAGLSPQQRANLDAVAALVDQINGRTRSLMVAYGLESQETVDAWGAAYQHYVPLQREDDGKQGIGRGFSVRGSSVKRAMGSDKNVIDILANIASQREQIIVRGEKNRVAQSLYGLALKAPKEDFWLPVAPFTAGKRDDLANQLIALGIDDIDAQSFANEPTTRFIDSRTGLVSSRINPAMRNRDNVLALRHNGKDLFLFFSEKDPRAQRMSAALKNLDADQLGGVMKAFAAVSRWFASVNTQYNPIFGGINFLRDAQGALLNLSTTPLRHHKREVIQHLPAALRGIYIDIRDARAGRPTTSTWAQLYDEFRLAGGQTGYRDMFQSSAARSEAIADELRGLTQNKALALGKGIFGWLSDYNETAENAVRLSAYKVARDKGMTPDQAASIAKNLTVNFNRKGQSGAQLGALFAFFNASVQGSARLAETLRGPAGKQIIGGGLLLGMLQAALFATAGWDDDEPPQFVRERNLLVPLPDGKYIAVPMPLGFHVLVNMGRIPTEWALGGMRNTSSHLIDMASLFIGAFNPVGGSDVPAAVTPTAGDPFVDLWLNRDFTGQKIYREDLNSLDPTPGFTRSRQTANIIAQTLAEWTNLASGGTDYSPGKFSPTAEHFEYLTGQITGGVGREIMRATEFADAAINGDDIPAHKIPLVGKFYGNTGSDFAEANRFYNNVQQMNIHENEILGRAKNGGDVDGYIDENPGAELYLSAGKFERAVAKLRKERQTMTGEDRRQIDADIQSLMREFNEEVRAATTD